MNRIKYFDGSLGKIQKKYGNVNLLSGKWKAATQNPKYNLTATGKLGNINRVTASYKGNRTNASVSRDLQGNTSANLRRQLRGNSSISGSINRPKGGGTHYGIKYLKKF